MQPGAGRGMACVHLVHRRVHAVLPRVLGCVLASRPGRRGCVGEQRGRHEQNSEIVRGVRDRVRPRVVAGLPQISERGWCSADGCVPPVTITRWQQPVQPDSRVLAIAAVIAGLEALRFYDLWSSWGWLTGNAALWVSLMFGAAAVKTGIDAWKHRR